MSNLIQIKRSENTATPTSLANGELAFSSNGNVLFVGNFGTVLPIAGERNPGTLTANQALVANSTSGIDKIIVANAEIRSITANGVVSPGNGYLLSVDAGGNTFWLDQGSVSINAAAQFSWTNTHSFSANVVFDDYVEANNLSVDGTLLANSTQLTVEKDAFFNANVAFGSDPADSVTFVAGIGSSLVPDANITYTLGTSARTWADVYTANLTATNISATDLSLTGNLTVTGTLTTVDTQNLVVQDPLIKLANGNFDTDVVDIGFFGVYDTSGTRDLYAGFYRDSSDNTFKIFVDSQVEPTTTVDPNAAGYTQGTLQAYLNSGALVSNSSAVTLAANSSVAVNITANTLTLSSALAGTSGGTGLNSYTAEDILVANSSNGFRTLAIGTTGQVLQSNGSALVYDNLDGGTF
jgi:hypothetical protein